VEFCKVDNDGVVWEEAMEGREVCISAAGCSEGTFWSNWGFFVEVNLKGDLGERGDLGLSGALGLSRS
jgi:hypothetical protein